MECESNVYTECENANQTISFIHANAQQEEYRCKSEFKDPRYVSSIPSCESFNCATSDPLYIYASHGVFYEYIASIFSQSLCAYVYM